MTTPELLQLMRLLSSVGVVSGLAALIVLAATAVPIWYQVESTQNQNVNIQLLEGAVRVPYKQLSKITIKKKS
jgi:hypothetical protein